MSGTKSEPGGVGGGDTKSTENKLVLPANGHTGNGQFLLGQGMSGAGSDRCLPYAVVKLSHLECPVMNSAIALFP
ncbi:histone acetyltransferase p300 [Biomphalaria glabrata]